jgi:hypothetical protein
MQNIEHGELRPANHLFAYTVQEYDAADGKKARSWTRIGVAFPHKDLHALPLNGRVVLFPPDSDDRAEEPAAAPPPPAPARAANPRRR